jgi:hypothetical protein
MKRTVGDKLYQRIKADRATDDIPGRAKSEGSETLLPEGRGGRHDVDEIGSPHDQEVFMFIYDRGGGNFLTGRCTHGTSGRAAPFEKNNPQNESERRLLWYSFVHFLARMQSTFLFGRLLCGVATLKERKGRGAI